MYTRMLTIFGNSLPKVEKVIDDNMNRLIGESSIFRKSVRGEAIGKLG